MKDPAKTGRKIPEREVKILGPPGALLPVPWPEVRGTASRKKKGWTWVVLHAPSAGEAWYPDERVVDP